MEGALAAFFAGGAHTAAVLYFATGLLSYLECAAFVGFLMPGESFVSLAGFLASRGVLELEVLIPLVGVCAFLGDTTGYLLGRWLGEPFLQGTHRFLRVPEGIIEAARAFFRRHGPRTVLIARFIGFLRSVAPFLAGASRSPIGPFLVYDFLGAAIWSVAFLLLGFYVGEGYKAAAHLLGRGVLVLVLGAAVAGAAFLLVRRYRVHLVALRFILRKEAILLGWFLSGVALLAAVTEEVRDDGTVAFDRDLLLWLHESLGEVSVRIMAVVTRLGSAPVIGILVAFVVLALVIRGRRRLAGIYAGAVITGIGVTEVMKGWMHRPRPHLWEGVPELASASFPSGHTTASSMAFWFLAWVLLRERRGGWRVAVAAAVAVIPVLVGFSRLALGVHWPTDVMGGFALALALLAPWVSLAEVTRGERAD